MLKIPRLGSPPAIESVLPYLYMARPYNAPAALASLIVGLTLVRPTIPWYVTLAALLVVLLIHSAFTIQNDIYDIVIDKANGLTDGLAGGEVSVKYAQLIVYATILWCLVIAYLSGYKLVFLGYIAIALFLAWAYNAPPIQASRRPLLSIAILGLYYSTAPLVFGLVLSGQFVVNSHLIIVCVILTRMSVSILKDYKDVTGDKRYGKRTFLQAFGNRAVAWTSTSLYLVGSLGAVLFFSRYSSNTETLIALTLYSILAIVGLRLRSGLFRQTKTPVLTRIFQRSFVLENFSCLVLALVLGTTWS